MSKRIIKYPIDSWQRHVNKMGPGFVPCMVSERWLQFPAQSAGHFDRGEFIDIQVMTNGSNDKPKKICDLILTREDLLKALDSVSPPSGSEE